MAENFIERLRMANIFANPGSNVNPAQSGGQPMGMPDMNPGPQFDVNAMIRTAVDLKENQRQMDQIRAYGDRDINAPHRIQNIGLGLTGQPQAQEQQMNHVFKDNSITPFQRESLALQRESLAQKGNTSSQNLAISARKQELAEKIAGGRATDEEKHEFRMSEIQERGDITSGQIDQRGNITSKQIGERTAGQKEIQNIRGDQQQDLQNTRGSQSLANIAARTAGQKEVKSTTPGKATTDKKAELPTQTRARMQNVIDNIRLTRPDLSQFIIEDANGNVMVDPSAGDAAFEINRMITGSKNTDIQLPNESSVNPKDKKKTQDNPETGDPLSIR